MATVGGVEAFGDPGRDEAFLVGVRSGIGRVGTTGAEADYETVLQHVLPLIGSLYEGGYAERLEPHAVELLSEMTATAAAVRIAHGEPPLTPGDVREFLPNAIRFFNTFVGCADPG